MGMEYFDEQMWSRLDLALVEPGASIAQALQEDRRLQVCLHDEALQDSAGKIVRIKWVRSKKGGDEQAKVHSRLVAQEFGYGAQ